MTPVSPLRSTSPPSSVWVIAYDVRSNKQRQRVARYLSSKGARMQKSVFTVRGTAESIRQIAEKLAELVHPLEDKVDFIPVCQACARRHRRLGPANAEGLATPDVTWEVV